ncbi:MFS transporter [Rothia uropygialis]|uniref:MFS transporter n=1 Tax=Kocuria sp. 36 TaxID=1415402 RepID=UPI00101D168B|nr:aromatic acid/H+ symport family MFS transporter [Kocuria sp. 36]
MASQSAPPTERITNHKTFFLVMTLCWLTVLFDGIDTFMYGATIPSMASDAGFDMTPSHAGNIGSYATFGMLIGALCAGMITDAIGRRWGIVACTSVFSLASAICALAPNAAVFGVFRTIAGIGLGGLLPTAIAMVSELAPTPRRNLSIGILMTAHQSGGIASGLLSLWLLPALGWRSLYWIGVLPLFLIVPLILALLPESLTYLVAKGRLGKARTLATRYNIAMPTVQRPEAVSRKSPMASLTMLFRGRNGAITVFFWMASFGGLLLVYGVSTWLPSLMEAEGFALGSSLLFLVTINLGGIFGLLVAGRSSDAWGPVRVSMIWFALTAIAIFCLGIDAPIALTYGIVFSAGFFLFSAQTMVYAAVAHVFPTESRGSAIGWTTGMGRFGAIFGPWMGGQLFALGLESWGFTAFALTSLFSVLMLLFISLLLNSTGGRALNLDTGR